jgi:DNA repair protein RadD
MSTALTPPPARDYQLSTVEGIREALRAGSKSVLAVLATGLGKTTVWALVAQLTVKNGNRAWFLAHRSELVAQGRERAELYGLVTGEISTEAKDWYNRPVQSAMLMTLLNRLERGEIKPHQMPQVVFIDEAHRAVSASYAKIVEQLRAAGARIVGLTATPWRLDKKPMGELFDTIVNTISISEAIERGFLLRPRYYGPEADLDKLKTKGNDYDKDELYKRFNKRTLYAGTVTNYENWGQGKPCVCYCINVDHSTKTRDAFNERGIAAVHVDGETPTAQRRDIIRDFKAGKYQVLCNADLFTEGLDIPSIGCVMLNRKTQSLALYIQMVGRGARPIAGQTAATDEARVAAIAASNKPYFVVIDQGGNLAEHLAWEMEREYSLEAPKKKKGLTIGVKPMKVCTNCASQIPAGLRACSWCSYEFPDTRTATKDSAFGEIDMRQFVISRPTPQAFGGKPPKVVPADLVGTNMEDWSDADWLRACAVSSYNKGWRKHQNAWRRGAGLREGLYQQQEGAQAA